MSNETIQEMENILKLQKKLYVEEGIPSLELRQDRLSSCLLYTSPSPRDVGISRMPSSA